MRATPLLIITHREMASSVCQRQVSYQHIPRPFCVLRELSYKQCAEDRVPRKIDIRLTLMSQPLHGQPQQLPPERDLAYYYLSTATARRNDDTTRWQQSDDCQTQGHEINTHSVPTLDAPIRRRACIPSVLVCGLRGGALLLRRYRHMGIFRPYLVRGTKKA